MLSCRDVARLASEATVHELPWGKRLSMRMHMVLCSVCRKTVRNMGLLRSFLDKLSDPESIPATPLPDDARERIKRNLSSET